MKLSNPSRNKLKRKAKKGFKGYPVGTIAFYGPDNKRASKVVVGIVNKEDAEPDFMQKWYSETGDVRFDINIHNEILEFINRYQPKSVVMVNEIIGCPHEEGIDYPEGEKCPQCPFWAIRDRWTGMVIN